MEGNRERGVGRIARQFVTNGQPVLMEPVTEETIRPPSRTITKTICICGGDGFPFGSATAVRIGMIGKALQRTGIDFRLLHCGPSPSPLNTSRSGVHEGIPYEYTTVLRRPGNRFLKFFVFAAAVAALTVRLLRERLAGHRPVIYLYVMHGPLNWYIGKLCRLLGLPLVQEMCEWWPGEPSCSKFSHWLYRKAIFANATDLLAISHEIENRVRLRAAQVNPSLRICYLPALVDIDKFGALSRPQKSVGDIPQFVWCGTVDAWLRDVLFLVRVFAEVRRRGYLCRLVIAGGHSRTCAEQIRSHAVENGLVPEEVVLTGWIDDAELEAIYSSAAALLLPLWNNDRSLTRMPNKLPEYLASARPVISARVGPVTELLKNGVDGCLVSPENESEFADSMVEVLEHPEWASGIGRRGRETCVRQFDYRSHSEELGLLFERSGQVPAARTARVALDPVLEFGRHLICSLAALVLILSGAVRRARARAFQEGVISAVYFHSPKPHLFAQCVHWLQKRGYTFISEREVVSFLHDRRPVPRGAVWLSFDDGAAALREGVLPLVEDEKVPVTLFIPSGIVAGSGLFPWVSRQAETGEGASAPMRDAMTVEELKEAASRPEVLIGSHTVTHAILPFCSSSAIEQEVRESKQQLESWLERPVDTFAYPNGQFDSRSEQLLAAAGYKLAVTTESGFVHAGDDPWRVCRFSVADSIFFPEAICNLVGVWRPWAEFAKRLLRGERSREKSGTYRGSLA